MTALVDTRRSLHAVAEHVLAAAQHAATGRVGLRRTPGGFGTQWFDRPGGGQRRVSVAGVDLVVADRAVAATVTSAGGGVTSTASAASGQRTRPLSTIAAAARLAEVAPGGPAEVYQLETPLEPDAPLSIDTAAAARIAAWFALVDAALARLAVEIPEEVATPQLWPEHFDLATTAAEVNYGGSPGDGGHDEPYLYVGPWHPPAVGGFWNEPFGASRGEADIADVDAALAFLLEGHERLAAA